MPRPTIQRSARPIIALTPNPALDRTLTLGRGLEPGTLHRVTHVREAAGGKGVNLARAVAALAASDPAGDPAQGDAHAGVVAPGVVVAGPLAGFNGRKFRSLLEAEGLAGTLTEVTGETRECTIVLDGGAHPTEINEAGPEVDEAAWRALLAKLPEGRLAVSGSLPPGTPPATFAALLADLPRPVVVDAHGPALLAALEAGAELVKPNRRELAEAASALGLTSPDDPLAAAEALQRRYGARVLVTLGEDGALLVCGRERWLAHAPRVDVVNPVGSGDCLLGAFLWAEDAGEPAERALALGVAAGADNARRGGGGTVDGAAVRELAGAVRTERLP
jgi:1-phosphofructokinase family hexose kinase